MLAAGFITPAMDCVTFQSWLEAMKCSAAEAARLLGVHPNTITAWKQDGAPQHVALACQALYRRLPAWGSSELPVATTAYKTPDGKFDRNAYQRNYMRQYMRRKRAEKAAETAIPRS